MKYLPQAPPFVMVDELTETNEKETITCFKIREGHLFVENRKFTEPGLIENLAQTAAAGEGFKAMEANDTPPVGFIGQIKNLEIYRLPEVGEKIITTVACRHQIMNVRVMEGFIECDNRKIAKAEFKVFLQNESDSAVHH